ncbi:hypothetical protein CBM2615_B170049 [Cupriavidus taiwanensis]|uniref:Uncharacterized protein n=1 Tax=Cupriavidus taiwanensis TaxID=164546 RepID=A0A375E9D1_9BURK|nr:hypothetical protein CBM2614_B180048 [Cupriavidus taiwanensis]SOZ65581.1 hypothetical protein CBM2615_B170049 [Cupriavidus taiwanensis]SOZ69241.1 hypothetical protein CBM2613_B140048 [Cupriavidus taiwanensis]SPA08420.1 hypothetical protein CBM2625_B150049 [Cupriavidus taiwanensis]
MIELIYPVTHPFAKINNLIAEPSLQSPSHCGNAARLIGPCGCTTPFPLRMAIRRSSSVPRRIP